MYEDNDTRFENLKDGDKPEENKMKDSATKKVVAGSVAGAVLGAGATYGAEMIVDGIFDKTDGAEQPQEQDKGATKQQVNEKESNVHSEKKHHAPRHRQDEEPSKTSVADEKTFLDSHDIKIDAIETKSDNDGNTFHVATGTVDGHKALFADDGDGHVRMAIVDENDNHNPDSNEYIDLSNEDITLAGLAENFSSEHNTGQMTEASDNDEDVEVKVIAVHDDVDMGGQSVDVAAITVNDNPVLLIDHTQNGEVDLIVADVNGNGTIENNEMADVSEQHIVMPTIDDVEQSGNIYTNNEHDCLPDYSDDSDITLYDI